MVQPIELRGSEFVVAHIIDNLTRPFLHLLWPFLMPNTESIDSHSYCTGLFPRFWSLVKLLGYPQLGLMMYSRRLDTDTGLGNLY